MELVDALIQAGPMGILVGYLVLRESEERKLRRELAAQDERLRKEEVAADIKLATALAALTTTINLKIAGQ